MGQSVTAATPDIVAFLRGLRREAGGFADTMDGDVSLRATLSVIKALTELGETGDDARVARYVAACRHASGGFSIKPDADPSPYDTSVALVTLRNLGRDEELAAVQDTAIAFMGEHAATQFDHFMLVAAYEECGITDPVPSPTVEFFRAQLAASLAAGKVLDTAIAAASLLRAGHDLPERDGVVRLMRERQDRVSGGFGDGPVSLFATYCATRTLLLLGQLPDTRRLRSYLASLATDLGASDAPGNHASAGATYQVLSMGGWIRAQQRIPVAAARGGDTTALRAWLAAGGDPDLVDADGWTVLTAAASRGHVDAVRLLLHPDVDAAPVADPGIRYAPADALPVYLAAQAGDLETVRLLLAAAPEQLHARSSVNGHTVLLQAAFYGKSRHLELARFVLDHAAELAGRPAAANREEQAQLLAATNVRGYNALGMQDLWHNQPMKDLLLGYYDGDAASERGRDIERRRTGYFAALLLEIAPPQLLTERLLAAIAEHLEAPDPGPGLARIEAILAQPAFEIDRLGGDLQMSPLVAAITGTDVGNLERAARRHALARRLLEAGADPTVRERHPMAVGAVIRASVLNNFGLLQLIAEFITPEAFAAEMNVSPAVNGLTAMHDAVHRALTSPDAELAGHLDQIRWMIRRGASLDIPDNTGQTQRQLLDAAQHDPAFKPAIVAAVAAAVAEALSG
jgi:hypothetical protein